MEPVYVIRNWRSLYEKDRNRACVDMKWVACPIGFDGEGYRTVITGTNGPAIYGAWSVLKLVAATCNPRGALVETSGDPHTPDSLSLITHLPAGLVYECMQVVSGRKVAWLVLCDTPEEIEATLGDYRSVTATTGADSRPRREDTHVHDVNACQDGAADTHALTYTSTGTEKSPLTPLCPKGGNPSDSTPGAVRKTKKQARAERKQAEIDDAVEFANRRVKR